MTVIFNVGDAECLPGLRFYVEWCDSMCGPKHPEEIVEQKRRDFLADIASVCKRHGVKFADKFRWEPCMFEEFPEFESEPVTESGHCFIVDLGDIEEAIRLAT